MDIAVGVPAWRPGKELAELEHKESPAQETFDEVRRRFRNLNGATWMEGVDYETWADDSANWQNG